MYERMLDKNTKPSKSGVAAWLGPQAAGLMSGLFDFLQKSYTFSSELKFPFGSQYGWGYKISIQNKLLCYIFFETGAFTVTVTFGKSELKSLHTALPGLSDTAREHWENRYPCGDGGWVHYRVLNHTGLLDVLSFLNIKKPPVL